MCLQSGLMKSLMARITSPGADPYIGAFAFLVTFFFLIGAAGMVSDLGVCAVRCDPGRRRRGQQALSGLHDRPAGTKGLSRPGSQPALSGRGAGPDLHLFLPQPGVFLGELGADRRYGGGRLGWSGAVLVAALGIWPSPLCHWKPRERARGLVLAVGTADAPLVLSRYLRTAWVTGMVLATVTVATLIATPARIGQLSKNF